MTGTQLPPTCGRSRKQSMTTAMCNCLRMVKLIPGGKAQAARSLLRCIFDAPDFAAPDFTELFDSLNHPSHSSGWIGLDQLGSDHVWRGEEVILTGGPEARHISLRGNYAARKISDSNRAGLARSRRPDRRGNAPGSRSGNSCIAQPRASMSANALARCLARCGANSGAPGVRFGPSPQQV
jgi:hypothetical protein